MAVTSEVDVGVLLAGLAALLVCLSKTLRYYLKFVVYLGYVTIMSIFLLPVFACRPLNVLNLV